ncbi:MAG TPA: hypothetical protein VJM82_02705 [Nitrospiraceae bacterium]|nr:hypothetical protein [Nitrospiraceae bacterium]
MAAFSGFPAEVSLLQNWSILFARKTDPDLDFDDELEDLDEKPSRGYYTRKPKKRRRSPLLWVLLLVILGGGAYFAMEPDTVMDLVGQWLGESPPMVAMPPAKPASRPRPAPSGTPAPVTSPQTSSPGPAALPSLPTPLFSQGQRVSVIPDPAPPGGSLSLSLDSAGTKPGPSVRAGTTLTVLDGELQNNVWVYSVRTEDGATGWIAERHLRPKL